MSLPIISVEGLSKAYRIGVREEGATTLAGAAVGALKAPFKNLRRLSRLNTFGEDSDGSDTHWALRDVSFEVAEGEVVGIIGRNGAGKSTLLKLLSRITEPTSGRAVLRGRVSSLLEVGTGFHPELTGRENVYLNGTILGMTKREVERKFDEIVEFSGIEKFLDTPIKRYSSGMTVRLAFAVAAHLEPEILIIDEVLAVGDAEFQKKCLGKMKEVAKGGRTVLFVSHNVQALLALTTSSVVLDRGMVKAVTGAEKGVAMYLAMGQGESRTPAEYISPEGVRGNHVRALKVHASQGDGVHRWGDELVIDVDLKIVNPSPGICFSLQLCDPAGSPVGYFWTFDQSERMQSDQGIYRLKCVIPKLRMYMGSYTVTTWLSNRRSVEMYEKLDGISGFDVSMLGIHREEYPWEPNTAAYLDEFYWEPASRLDEVATEPANNPSDP